MSLGILSLGISISVFFLDLLTKASLSRNLSLGQSVPVIKGIFHLSLVHNTGIAFGLFKNQTLFFVSLSLITILYIIADFILHLKRYTLNTSIALGLLLGGAGGNLLDRLRFGYVIDFLDFRIWPVFNIADSMITIGIFLLIIEFIARGRRQAACGKRI